MIEVELPDGTIAEFPDGTPPDVMKAAIQRRIGQQSATGVTATTGARIGVPRNRTRESINDRVSGYYGGAAPASSDDALNAMIRARQAGDPIAARRIERRREQMLSAELDPTRDMSGPRRVAAGAGMALSDTALGLKQIAGNVEPGEVEERRRINAPLMNTAGGFTGNVLTSAGMIAAPVPGGPTLSRVLPRAAPYVSAAARNMAFAASQPVAEGESRAVNTTIAGGVAIPAQAAANVTSRIIAGSRNIDPARRAALDTARAEGIPVTTYQASTNPTVRRIGSTLAQLPGAGTGDVAAAQTAAFNRALSRSFGMESETLEPALISAARARLGSAYEDIWSRNNVNLDGGTIARLSQIANNAKRSLPSDNADVVQRQIQYVLQQAQGGAMPGRIYQNLRGELVGEGATGEFIKQIRRALDNAANRSVGQADAAALRLANQQYNNLRVVEDGLRQAAGAADEIKPERLWALINRQGRPRATPEMTALARVGQTVLKDPIPDSGTAGRLAVLGGLGGIAGLGLGTETLTPEQAIAMASLGLVGGRALNSNRLGQLYTRGAAPNSRVLIGLSRRAPAALVPAAGAAYAEDGR